MASIHINKNCKNYIAHYTGVNGKRTTASTGVPEGGDKKLAQKMADEWENAARLARAGMLVPARARKVVNDILERAGQEKLNTDTVEKYLHDWLKGTDNAGTSERYTNSVELFLKSLGDRSQALLSDISHNDILKFIESREGNAPSTMVNQIKPVFKDIANAYEKLDDETRISLWADKEISELLDAIGLKPFEKKAKTEKPVVTDEALIAFSNSGVGRILKDFKTEFAMKIKDLKPRLEALAKGGKIPEIPAKLS
jgi:hypothetical protein